MGLNLAKYFGLNFSKLLEILHQKFKKKHQTHQNPTKPNHTSLGRRCRLLDVFVRVRRREFPPLGRHEWHEFRHGHLVVLRHEHGSNERAEQLVASQGRVILLAKLI